MLPKGLINENSSGIKKAEHSIMIKPDYFSLVTRQKV